MANKEIFEQLAKQYDTPERIKLAKIITSEVQKHLVNTSEKTLVDYGSGTGLVSLPLSANFREVFLLDAAASMLEIADQKIQEAQLPNVLTLTADFLQTPVVVKADVLIVSLVLLHIPETEKILQAFYHHLNPGGKLIIIDFDKNEKINHPKVHNGFTQKKLQKLLLKTGFSDSESYTFYQGKQVFMREDASLFLSISTK